MAPKTRIAVAVTIGLAMGTIAFVGGELLRIVPDFGTVWFGARELLAARNPYLAIGPGRAYEWPNPLYYPLPAVLLATPFAMLSLRTAAATFVALSAGILAFALSRNGWVRLPVFLSMASIITALLGQWSFIVAAGALVPMLGFVYAAKPTVGLAALAYNPSWKSLMGALGLTVLAFAWQPGWLSSYVHALGNTTVHFAPNTAASEQLGATIPYFAPISRFGGFLLPLSLLRWRRPEARLLLVLALMPQTMVLYGSVLLYLIPETVGESAGLALLSYVAWLGPAIGGTTQGDWIVVCQFLPCLVMVLRRPNNRSFLMHQERARRRPQPDVVERVPA